MKYKFKYTNYSTGEVLVSQTPSFNTVSEAQEVAFRLIKISGPGSVDIIPSNF